jgi:hypothetical protein
MPTTLDPGIPRRFWYETDVFVRSPGLPFVPPEDDAPVSAILLVRNIPQIDPNQCFFPGRYAGPPGIYRGVYEIMKFRKEIWDGEESDEEGVGPKQAGGG